jgi:ATPase subunit of ABC transporter with duplicated ATPase domains
MTAVLKAVSLSKSYDSEFLFRNVGFTVTPGDRIALVGPNGAGKSTLLALPAGHEPPSSGRVELSPGTGLGYFTQQVPDPHALVGDFLGEGLGEVWELEREMAALLRTGRTVFEYFRSQVPVYAEDAEELLAAHMFGPEDWSSRLRDLSAGGLRRLLLAVIVNSPARVLMLDEPTNYLDFDALDIAEEALRAFGRTLVMVTHDAYFAERVGWTRRWEVRDGSVSETVSADSQVTPPGGMVSPR